MASGSEAAAALPPLARALAGPEGAPVVTFVPGIGNDRHFWAGQAERLAARYRTLSFDPWGHGESPPPPPDCRFADIVRAVVRLWDDLGIRRSALVGLGFGGSVALAAALDHSDRVARVAAFCCRARQPDERREFWRGRRAKAAEIGIARLADITVERWLSEAFRARRPDVDRSLRAMFRRTSLGGYQAHVGAFIEMDFEARLRDLAVPTLLVAAEHDHGGGPVEAMRAMAERIPNAELAIIAGAGHICTVQAPDRVAELLDSFLAPLLAPACDLDEPGTSDATGRNSS